MPHPVGAPQPDDGDGDGVGVLGPGQDIRPHRASRRGPAPLEIDLADPGVVAPHPGGGRKRRLGMLPALMLTASLLLGGAAGVLYLNGDSGRITEILRLSGGDGGGENPGTSTGKVATAPLDGRTTAVFEVAAATTRVSVRTADLGPDLFRVTAGPDSGTAPRPAVTDGRVRLHLTPDGAGAEGDVEIVLAAGVTWSLRFLGGADEQVVDLTGGKISSADFVGGSRSVRLTLPQPAGTVPVRVIGALDDLTVTAPAGIPVRVQVDSGAKTVSAGSRTLRDVAPGSTLTPKNWEVPDRYDVDAASRVTLLTVTKG